MCLLYLMQLQMLGACLRWWEACGRRGRSLRTGTRGHRTRSPSACRSDTETKKTDLKHQRTKGDGAKNNGKEVKNQLEDAEKKLQKTKNGRYQEVGGRRHGDAVVEQLPRVVVHRSTAFHRLQEMHRLRERCVFGRWDTALILTDWLILITHD